MTSRRLSHAWSLALLVLSLATAGVTRAEDSSPPTGWTFDSRAPGAVIFYREDERAHARAYQAVGEVEAPPDAVFAVVTDVEAHPRFIPFTTESTIVQRVSPTELIVHQVISPPVIGARDAFFRITTTPGASPNTVWRSAWTAVPDFGPEQPGRVRLRVAEGTWLFEPLDGGNRTRMTYTSLTNVGGAVPAWMANTQTASVIRTMFDAIRARVRGSSSTPR